MRYERDGFSVEAARKKRRKLPDWYVNRPPDVKGSAFFYEAYRDLATERRHAEGAIPWSACRLWCRDLRLQPDIANAVWIVVSRMDLAERQWRYEQLKAESGGG